MREEILPELRKLGAKAGRSGLEALMGYGRGEIFILNFLYFKACCLTPSELAEALGASMPRVSAILGNMERKGEIVREVSKANRNHVLVSLTEIGASKANRVTEALDKSMIEVAGEMGEEKLLEFIRLSNLFLDALEKHPAMLGDDLK
ncbi:MAG: hypothetical protein LBT59_29800 [Clostridiales bacterium]|nr:hypothetical protein [Clostridiales bacterium]